MATLHGRTVKPISSSVGPHIILQKKKHEFVNCFHYQDGPDGGKHIMTVAASSELSNHAVFTELKSIHFSQLSAWL